jgi:hypothetical protein
MNMKKALFVLVVLIGIGSSVFAETYYYYINAHKFEGGSISTTDCYSGTAEYRNSPYAINMKDKGPIPIGTYRISERTGSKGPYTFTLVPESGTELFGRDGFLIHGDSSSGNASTGCIVMRQRTEREKIVVGSTLVVRE